MRKILKKYYKLKIKIILNKIKLIKILNSLKNK